MCPHRHTHTYKKEEKKKISIKHFHTQLEKKSCLLYSVLHCVQHLSSIRWPDDTDLPVTFSKHKLYYQGWTFCFSFLERQFPFKNPPVFYCNRLIGCHKTDNAILNAVWNSTSNPKVSFFIH